MPPDFYKNYPSIEFIKTITQTTRDLDEIGEGVVAGARYDAMKIRLTQFVNEADNEINFADNREIYDAIAVLTQELDILKKAIDQLRFDSLIEVILDATHIGNREGVCKRILRLYYTRFLTFEAGYSDGDAFTYFLENLQDLLDQYEGNNRMTLKAKGTPELIDGDLGVLLDKFTHEATLADIQSELRLQEHYEILLRIRLLRLVQKIQTWEVNQYDAGVQRVFEEVKEYKDTRANNQRFLAEEAVHLMVLLCRDAKLIPIDKWQHFIFDMVGDPRAQRNHHAWQRVGDEERKWFVGVLSRGDLREFLETMTDGQGDEIYQYRKQFWLQFVDYAVNAKIMLGNNAFSRLRRDNRDMWQRFDSSPETYSRLQDAYRSCVFIDFGTIYVIEGTHNAMLRIYETCPIDLTDDSYKYEEFHRKIYTDRPDIALVEEIRHTGSENYSWQRLTLLLLNQKIPSSISLDQIKLDADKRKSSWVQPIIDV